MKTSRILLCLGALLLMLTGLLTTSASAGQMQKLGKAKSKMTKMTREDAMTKVKMDDGKPVHSKHLVAPSSKGGKKTAAPLGRLHVDNHTGAAVDIFLDGEYAGTVGAYGDLYITTDSATYSLFGVADDGTYGPMTTYLGNFTWSLY